MTEDKKETRDRPVAINLGDAKIGKLSIDGITTIGNMDGITANAPEIAEASISNTLHIQQVSNMSAQDIGLLLHQLNVLRSTAPELESDIMVVHEAITKGNFVKSALDKSKGLLLELLSKAKDKATSELLEMACDALKNSVS